jgi:REP-associated tyrosine transposase
VLEAGMASKRTSHAVYETKYHLVWAPKYRKGVLRGALRERVEELLREIVQDFGFEIDTLEVAVDHVHIFLDFPPRYSIAKVRELWGGEYFAWTVGDKVTAEVIRRYIRQHQGEARHPRQLKLF